MEKLQINPKNGHITINPAHHVTIQVAYSGFGRFLKKWVFTINDRPKRASVEAKKNNEPAEMLSNEDSNAKSKITAQKQHQLVPVHFRWSNDGKRIVIDPKAKPIGMIVHRVGPQISKIGLKKGDLLFMNTNAFWVDEASMRKHFATQLMEAGCHETIVLRKINSYTIDKKPETIKICSSWDSK